MAINKSIQNFEIEVLNKNKLKYDGLSWCELGNQLIVNNDSKKKTSGEKRYILH